MDDKVRELIAVAKETLTLLENHSLTDYEPSGPDAVSRLRAAIEEVNAAQRLCVSLVCRQCGHPGVQVSAWVEVNTERIIPGEGPSDAAFCPNCEAKGEDGYDCGLDGPEAFDVEEAYGLPEQGKPKRKACR